ncbi:MAG TPA: bacteriohemerythrin [Bacteroidales bacterium]|nr:bacteriohemerythrin [Bacteroidales bacterium]
MNILIHWKKEYELGIKEIDQHHKKLVDLINMAYDSHISNIPGDTLQQVTTELIDYAFVHFKFEEKYFEKFGYEHAEEHIREHQFFTKKIAQLQSDWRMGSAEKKQVVIDFLKKWLDHHILNSDKRYVDCFRRNGM